MVRGSGFRRLTTQQPPVASTVCARVSKGAEDVIARHFVCRHRFPLQSPQQRRRGLFKPDQTHLPLQTCRWACCASRVFRGGDQVPTLQSQLLCNMRCGQEGATVKRLGGSHAMCRLRARTAGAGSATNRVYRVSSRSPGPRSPSSWGPSGRSSPAANWPAGCARNWLRGCRFDEFCRPN